MAYGTAWHAKVRNLLNAEMQGRAVGYRELARRLNSMGSQETEASVANKLSRGSYSAAFFIQCLSAIGAEEMHLDLQELVAVPIE